MATVNVTIRMDEELKKQAEGLFSDFGLSFNAAMTMFAKQAVREQRIPFEVKRNDMEYISRDRLLELVNESMDRNAEAYKELAK